MKTSLLALIAMLSISCAFSQDTIETLVANYERSKGMTLAYIEAMPAEEFGFKPTPEIRSYAEQLLHLAQGTFGLTANGTGADRMYASQNLEQDSTLQSKEEVKRIVNESFDYAISSIKAMDPSSLGEMVERGPFSVSRLGWIQKADEHITHHRGQCAIYLRLKGIAPPQYKLF